jgi:hypothetical protein
MATLETQKNVEACVCELQEPLYRAARVYGSRVLLRAIALIVGASLRALIFRNRMTRMDACRIVDSIEKTALGSEEPPPGAEIPESELRAA